jgi:hypothetical protein
VGWGGGWIEGTVTIYWLFSRGEWFEEIMILSDSTTDMKTKHCGKRVALWRTTFLRGEWLKEIMFLSEVNKTRFSLFFINHLAIKTWWNEDMAPPFFTSALDVGEESASRHSRFTPCTSWVWGWLDPNAGLDITREEKNHALPEIKPRPSST